MFTATNIKSTIKPDICEPLGNGVWYYNYNILEETLDDEVLYSFIQIRVNGRPTYKLCVESIIREFVSQTQEFDLINSANKAILLGDIDSKDIKKYKEYLKLIEEIKEKVASDLGK